MSRIPSSDRVEQVEVCLIESNPLALHYLRGLLSKDVLLRLITLEDLLGGASRDPVTLVFVLDNPGLPIPLSDYLRRLRERFADARFLVMDQDGAEGDVVRLLWLGIDGFVAYRDVPQSLAPAIHSVGVGKMWVSREILKRYVQWTKGVYRGFWNGLEGLTFREDQILELAKRRLSNKEIAEVLRIRESTVKFHLSNVFSKLHVNNRHALLGKDSYGLGRAEIPLVPAYSHS